MTSPTPEPKFLALTFDDGPHSEHDPLILHLLARYGAAATFFVIGAPSGDYDAALRRILDAGCEIGNHGWTHRPLPTLAVDEQLAELALTNERLAAAGVSPIWFRPPFGATDAMTATVAGSLGLETMLWTVDSRDWDGSPPDVVARRAIEGMAPGAVILLHSPADSTMLALPDILAAAAAGGYRCLTLSAWKRAIAAASPGT